MIKDPEKRKIANRERQRRFRAKNKDSAKLAQKQGLKNAPESPTIDELSNTIPITPSYQKRLNLKPLFIQPIIPKGEPCQSTK